MAAQADEQLAVKPNSNTADVLNRLLAIHYRSLPMYLIWASPYRRPEDEHAWNTIQQIVEDQKALSARIVELIVERNWRVDYGDFPITFTGSHDLSLDFLIRRLVQWQKGTIAAIQECYDALADDPVAQGLADECLGTAKAHLEILQELLAAKQKPADEMKLHKPEPAEQH
jgi:hypothetical protein